jgi:NAD(P)-dependent dehydrogenase (short-subunit alcohol dehydrogenase family)
MLLKDKVAVVTGAGGGIGRAEALLFAREGARVVVNDVGAARDGTGADASVAERVVGEIVAAGGAAVASADSVASPEGADRIVELAVRTFGRLDVLVNNAGITRDKTLLKMDPATWRAVLAVRLDGALFCIQAAARQMIAQGGGGRIVNTTGPSGMLGGSGWVNDAAAASGIYGLTRAAAIELQKHRVLVNAIAPIAKTRSTEDLPMMQGMDALTPEHVAPAALFLASDLCEDRTGQVLAVAGARVYAYKVVESAGRFKEQDAGIWTAEEISLQWPSIVKT